MLWPRFEPVTQGFALPETMSSLKRATGLIYTYNFSTRSQRVPSLNPSRSTGYRDAFICNVPYFRSKMPLYYFEIGNHLLR